MRNIKKLVRTLTFLSLALIAGFTLYNLFVLKPRVENIESLSKIPKKKVVTLTVSPRAYTKEIKVIAIQGGKEITLFSGELPPGTDQVTFSVEPRQLGLVDGKAKIIVELRRLLLLTDRFEIESLVDTTPPGIRILHSPYSVLQGGSGGVKVKLSEPAELYLEVGGRRFRSYKLDNLTYLILFGVPIEASTKEVIKVVAQDEAGNRAIVTLSTKIKRNRFPTFRIELVGKEKLMLPKLKAILRQEREGESFVSIFKRVNEDIRNKNEGEISRIGKKSFAGRLWSGKFLQMKNSKVVSIYGEKRIYLYRGKAISESRHMGYDLASVKNARVPASNSGVVVFAGDLGIYGNTVIIDHGYGLMSLYAHLADFRVKKGDKVKKGQTIGYTDTTGLAFGDHLHFGILIDGYEVTPLEWWDSNWIESRIEPLFSR